jgi:hypothetical protein
MRFVFAILTLQVCLAQTEPQGFWSKQVQYLEAPETFTPQTSSENLHAYLLSMAGPIPILSEAASAGIAQALNSPPEWGQGAAGFGKRFGNNLAYNGMRQSLAYASSILLNEDDRYIASREQGIWRRTRHALVGVFTGHKPDGRAVFATSNMVGIVGASAIQRAWLPARWQTALQTANSVAISLAGTAGSNLVREFLPDFIHRRPSESRQP